MKSGNWIVKISILLFCFSILTTCKISLNTNFRQVYDNYNSFIHADTTPADFIKVHQKNGFVSVFDKWEINPAEDSIIGNGKDFNLQRNLSKEGKIAVDLKEIAIIETNQLSQIQDRYKKRLARLTILTAADAALGLLCITTPKACFGSCPTFYINGNNNLHYSDAEGFSSCISPSLEKNDIDALNYKFSGDQFKLTMKNEALETHAVNQIQLLAAEVIPGKSVFHGFNDKFYSCSAIYDCNNAFVNSSDISAKIKGIDDYEYFSLTDSTNLWEKEEIIFIFNTQDLTQLGLILNFRQTLLTTFLLYNGISYMGDEVGDYFAKIETNKIIREKLGNPFKKLGGIKISYFDERKAKWIFVDEIYETGPIAKNLQLVPLNNAIVKNPEIKIKLELTRGLWRLDYLALASIEKEINPVFLSPSEIIKNNLINFDNLTEAECDDENYLISMPGDLYEIYFEMPERNNPDTNYELFLSVKGYYLEWMRGSWLEAKDTGKLEKMLLNDKLTWNSLAREYKVYESQMEELFWNSKYVTTQ